jgi:hypothetical protein
VPYTPQQNGVAERKNRSLKEMANCMLQSKSLAPKMWAEAINFAACIQNRVPHKSLKGTTPFECWTGKKPKVPHFHIFGSRAWAHIPTDKRKALEPQIVECIFFGYHEGVKGYRLLDSHTENFILARSVKFEEESPHDFSEDPVEEPLVVTDEEESENSSSTSKQPSEHPFRSNIEDEEQVMSAPTQLPTWAEKTLQDAGELVGHPTDTRRTRSQFFGAPQAMDATENLMPIHCYMSLGSNPNSHSEVADIFTKSFTENKFSELRAMLGVVETTE